ncbi:MAG: iron-containing redox enzyme family protein [Solirubrobacteraceae bacterium]
MDVLSRLDRARAATNVLEHPFYRRWTDGRLSREELGRYAGEYRHAVIALADASLTAAEQAGAQRLAAGPGLRRHAEEERAHVALWERFADACGCREQLPPLEGTRGCVAAWTAGTDLLESLAVLYAIEAGQPEISGTKLAGLRQHYGYVEEGPATDYFSVHQVRDLEHAAAAAALITELLAGVEDREQQAERMVRRAEAALRGNWRLLDSVEAVD